MFVWGQSTQGLISGRIVNSVNGEPIAKANLEYTSQNSLTIGTSLSDSGGFYFLPLLSPGIYRVRVVAERFQSQEVQELELPVAARLELDFRVRPLSDVWEKGQYKSVFLPGTRTVVTFFGPDVDTSRSGSFDTQKGKLGTLESTVSAVIDSSVLENLPLAGRDVYNMLVTQPGVTSDASTARGLGLSINGQRPSSSNYLLDGLENNNYLVTGPLTRVAPEAIQEYRISTNNFSAEYGRTSGFLANAITRSGSNAFHGLVYFYIKKDVLNANGFQENLQGLTRPRNQELQPGFVVGGPVRRNRLYFSSTFEQFANRGQLPARDFNVPSASFIPQYTVEGRKSRALLQQYPPPFVQSLSPSGTVKIAQPAALDRTLAIERMDYHPSSGKDRFMGRLMASKVTNPYFIWTPYKDFITPLHQDTYSLGLSYIHTFRPSLTSEARFGFSNDDLNWNRAHPEIPTLVSAGFDQAILPGSPAFYSYRNANRSWEALDNIMWNRGRHLIVAGGGMLNRRSEGYLTAGEDGEFSFSSIVFFALDRPSNMRTAVQRTPLPALRRPDSNRNFGYTQMFGFVQDTYRVSPRLTINYGLRYELFGAPQNRGEVKDALLMPGSGATLAAQIASAGALKLGSGNQQLFGTDKTNWAGRAGASYDLFGNGRALLRGGYGIFYDRPFDNLWQNMRNNDFILASATLSGTVDFLQPNAQLIPLLLANRNLDKSFPGLTVIDPTLRNGYAHSYFGGVQSRVTNSLTFELNGMGSFGRRLIVTDIVNREFSTDAGRYNPGFPDISYRSNQGESNYNALTMAARYRASRGALQALYTWSHVLDTQSDPLSGDFFDLSFTNQRQSSNSGGRAAFPIQFNPASNRGNSDFDQRHNFVLWSYWELPAGLPLTKLAPLFRGWTVSQLAAFRTGLPFNIIGTSTVINGRGLIWNDRPDVINSSGIVLATPFSVAGGRQLLDPTGKSLKNAAPSTLGSLGRNVFHGPGLYNLDLSITRAVALRWLGDGGRIVFRADAYNALNHANLSNPDSLLTSDTFGRASYGRQGASTGFPASSPLNETARQIQLSVRIVF